MSWDSVVLYAAFFLAGLWSITRVILTLIAESVLRRQLRQKVETDQSFAQELEDLRTALKNAPTDSDNINRARRRLKELPFFDRLPYGVLSELRIYRWNWLRKLSRRLLLDGFDQPSERGRWNYVMKFIDE